MSNERYKLEYLEYEAYYVDTKQEYIDEDEPDLKFDGLVTMTNKQVVDLSNKQDKKNLWLLKVIFALGNYAENNDYERINTAVNKVKKSILDETL